MTGHVPVLVREVVDALQPAGGARYLDGTFGAGGYTNALLDKADCQVIALDRDPDAIAAGQALAERYAPRLRLIEGRFGDMAELLAAEAPLLDMRMSSGPEARKEKPRSARSNCIDETPRSSATPSTSSTPSADNRSAMSPKRPSIRRSRGA